MTLNNNSLIKVVNKRTTSYTVSFPTGEYYVWMPSMGGIDDEHELTFKQVQNIHMRSVAFKEGSLFIDNADARKRLGLEKEEIKAFTMSRDEIESILKGNMVTLKKLDKYKDNQGLIREVINIAKELKVDNHNKLKYLSELSGVPVEILTESASDE